MRRFSVRLLAGSAAASFDRTLGGSARSALALWSSVLSLGPFAGAIGLDVVSSQSVRSPGRPSSYYWSSTNPHANSFFPKQSARCPLPYGLAVRIPGFHPGGPGSTPGMGSSFRFPSAYAPSHEPHNKPTVCFQLPGLFLICWTPFKWLKTVALNYVD